VSDTHFLLLMILTVLVARGRREPAIDYLPVKKRTPLPQSWAIWRLPYFWLDVGRLLSGFLLYATGGLS
jgi:hypothetical protein